MAFSYYDMVMASTATTGTGSVTMGSAVAPYRAFSGIVANGATVRYRIADVGSAWERGWGVYNSSTGVLTRNLECSSTGSLLSLTGAAVVEIVAGAPDLGSPHRYKTTTYTALAGEVVFADTSAASWSLSLPASPNTGDSVEVNDAYGTFGAYPLTVLGNGANITGLTYSGVSSITLNAPGNNAKFVYNGSVWRCVQAATGIWASQSAAAAASVTFAGLVNDGVMTYRLLCNNFGGTLTDPVLRHGNASSQYSSNSTWSNISRFGSGNTRGYWGVWGCGLVTNTGSFGSSGSTLDALIVLNGGGAQYNTTVHQAGSGGCIGEGDGNTPSGNVAEIRFECDSGKVVTGTFYMHWIKNNV